MRVPVQTPEPSAPKAITRQEELDCFRKLQRHVHSRQPLYIAVFTFLLYTGVRAGELCGIDLGDIQIMKVKNGYRGEVTVRGKGNKYRTIPVPHQACQAVTDWLEVRPEVGEKALFLSTQRNRLNVRGVERICEKAGTHPHALRHTYLTRLVRHKDIDIVIAAELAGHSSVKTTQRYTKPSKQELLDAIERAF